MIRLLSRITAISVLLLPAAALSGVASADANHARIVRLSLVEGDVRFARDIKGDPLADSHASWEAAVLNLPIRQGYVVATDSGRAEVEFENGAMAFLSENSVLQFYDLSAEDGGFTTRLILRQGSAEFYVNPARGDYFSVTGGDFSVEANGKTTFRLNNFDDGSNVSVLHGRLTALTNGKSTELEKNQSLSMRAGDAESVEVGRAPDSDDFDQWVSGRIDSTARAATAALDYSRSAGYTSGFGDLYTYGSWFPVAGYGYCWRPYGVGLGWSPFDFGNWYYDPFFGWGFIGSQPWGWLPYHYGGWLFQPGVGWAWNPARSAGAGGIGRWRPVTGVWLRSGGTVGIVPSHPLDVHGKAPLNLSSGVFAVTSRGVTGQVPQDTSARWKVENKPGREIMQSQLANSSAPVRVSRPMAASAAGAPGERPGIVYDRAERKFVNSNAAADSGAPQTRAGEAANNAQTGQKAVRIDPDQGRTADVKTPTPPRAPAAPDRVNAREGQARQVVPARTPPAPPHVPRAVTSERVFHETGAGNSGAGAGPRGGSSPPPSAGAPRSAPAPSAPPPSAAPRSSGGNGGRPH
jgi:FecR protein